MENLIDFEYFNENAFPPFDWKNINVGDLIKIPMGNIEIIKEIGKNIEGKTIEFLGRLNGKSQVFIYDNNVGIFRIKD